MEDLALGLANMKKYKILVDTNVFSIADPAKWVRVPPPPKSRFSNPMLLMKGNKGRNEKAQTSLQAIGDHCRKGYLLLFRTSELMYEDWQGRQSRRNNLTNFYAFKDCKIDDIKSPIERSFFYTFSDFDGNQLQTFIEKLLKIKFSNLMDMLKDISIRESNVFEYNTVTEESFNWFKELCARLHKNKYRDAFHFWGAEHNKIDFFLTEDIKFRNELLTSLKDGGLNCFCKAIRSVELVSQLQIETDSVKLPEVGGYYDCNGRKISYP